MIRLAVTWANGEQNFYEMLYDELDDAWDYLSRQGWGLINVVSSHGHSWVNLKQARCFHIEQDVTRRGLK